MIKFYYIFSIVILVTPPLLAIISIIRLFKDQLTTHIKIIVSLLMLIAGFAPILKIPLDKAYVRYQKMIPPKIKVDMGPSEEGNLFVIADSENQIPYKARWVICTKNNIIVNGIMLGDVVFYPTPAHSRLQYKEEIDKNKVVDNYIELRFDYKSLYSEEMGMPNGLSGEVVRKYQLLKDPPFLKDLPI